MSDKILFGKRFSFGFPKNRLLTKGRVFASAMILVALLVMVAPAFANTSNWSWTGTVDGRVVNGKANGVFHNMTAGSLTFAGSLWATYVSPGATSPSLWTYQVKKDNGIWADTTICTYYPVSTDGVVGHSTYFSTGCGTIVAGNDYYLYVYRGSSDGRSYSSSGTLQTP